MSQWNWYDTTNNAYVVPNPNDDLYFVGNQSPGDHTYLPVPMTATPGSPEYMMMVMQGMPVNEPYQPRLHGFTRRRLQLGRVPGSGGDERKRHGHQPR